MIEPNTEIVQKPAVEMISQPAPISQPEPISQPAIDQDPRTPDPISQPASRKKGKRGRPRKKTAQKKAVSQPAPADQEPADQEPADQEPENIPDINNPEEFYRLILRQMDVYIFKLPPDFQDEQDAYLLKSAFEQYINNDAPAPIKKFFANNSYLLLITGILYKRFEAAK